MWVCEISYRSPVCYNLFCILSSSLKTSQVGFNSFETETKATFTIHNKTWFVYEEHKQGL